VRLYEEALSLASPDRNLKAQLTEELARITPPPLPTLPAAEEPAPPTEVAGTRAGAPPPPVAIEDDSDDDGPPARVWTSSVPPPPDGAFPVAEDEPAPTPILASPVHVEPPPLPPPLPRPTPPPLPQVPSAEPPPLPTQRDARVEPAPETRPAGTHVSSDPPAVPEHVTITASPPDYESIPPSVQVASGDERMLFRELLGGSVDAGERLLAIYAAGPGGMGSRPHDVLTVRKHQAALRPGDRSTLDKVHAAAMADNNSVYARAIEHVLRGFDPGAGQLPPPPLMSQREATPEVVSSLLFRNPEPANEALALAWETGMFRREANHYRLTGLERVQLGAGTVVGDAYAGVARLLGAVRTPLFHPRGPGALQAQIALLSPPAVILVGDVKEESSDLRYMLGASLAGAMPEHALVNGWPEESVSTLLETLIAAFGPVDASPRPPSSPRLISPDTLGRRGLGESVAKLEQDLWQLIPPRGARRLAELCADTRAMTSDAARKSTRRAMRRSGLFACGSLATAVRMAVAELRLDLDTPLTHPEGLFRACAAHPEVADLVRLATRTEYAEARWQPATASDLRRTESGSRFRAGT